MRHGLRSLLPLAVSLALLHAAPGSTDAWRARSDQAAQQGAADRATPEGSARIEQAYRSNNIGVAHLEQFDYTTAEAAFREALRLEPDLAIARLNLAIALLYSGRFDVAIDEARSATKLLPDAPGPHFVLGLAAKADNQLEEAMTAFRQVLRLDPDDPGARIHLAQIHLQERRFDEALSLASDALAAEPYNVTAAYTVALALTRAGQSAEGQRAMERFEALRDSAYGVTYSQLYLGQGRHGEALASTGAEPDLVDPGTPAVTFSDATGNVLPSPVPQAVAPRERGGITLFDADGDGRLDLLVAGGGPLRFFRNDNGRLVEDAARLPGSALENARGAIAGDYDNDGRPDLFVLLDRGYALLRQTDNGRFEDVGARALPPSGPPASAAAFADVDHDGDLDILTAGASVRLLRNNGDGTFTDISSEAGVEAAPGPARGIAAVDFDNRRDIDIFLAAASAPPMLLRNMRDGTFRAAAADAGLPPAAQYSALAIADVNKDGYTDLFLGRADEPGLLVLGDGRGGFRTHPAPDDTRGAIAAQFVDYDNDGLLDLFTLSAHDLRLFRNLGGGKWVSVTADAGLDKVGPGDSAFQTLAAGDLDSNGRQELIVGLTNGDLRVLKSDAPAPNRSVRVRLEGRVSNRSGVGSRIEIRAGSLRQMLDATASTPAVAPADFLFGLGTRATADVVRVLWPSGILQAETDIGGATATIEITELDRKPSSCPYLFTWNGERFEFVTDVMGGGETGAWLAPAVWNVPDPDEYVRIRSDQLQPRGNRYEIRLTNELEEALFLERVQLIAVDHAADTDVYPNEGLRSAPRPPFALHALRDARPPVRAADGHGRDVLPAITGIDRRYADTFEVLPIRGYAEPHELVLDLGDAPEDAVLLLTGWTDYAFSNDNVAASQLGVAMSPPSLQVRDRQGAWRTVLDEIGFPVGRPQTVPVDLAGRFLSASREVRILTNMRIYWDQILVARPDRSSVGMTRLDPTDATLRWRGFSAEITPDEREPYAYDYHRVSAYSPWKAMIGRYTREGDVRALLRRVDDMFVISQPGDEIALSFRALPPPAPGRVRTFLFYVHGYSKEMNPRSATPDTVGPLPFRAMSGYPYPQDEHYPRTRAHRRYLERYNTRIVHRAVPSIDATAVRAGASGIDPRPDSSEDAPR
jgi:tetratricopeptide (TPR) repeat protein